MFNFSSYLVTCYYTFDYKAMKIFRNYYISLNEKVTFLFFLFYYFEKYNFKKQKDDQNKTKPRRRNRIIFTTIALLLNLLFGKT